MRPLARALAVDAVDAAPSSSSPSPDAVVRRGRALLGAYLNGDPDNQVYVFMFAFSVLLFSVPPLLKLKHVLYPPEVEPEAWDYEAEIADLYTKLKTAFPSALFVWATTTPIKGDASIEVLNERALAALPSDIKVHDLHASILNYCEKEGSETCSLHEPAGPLTPAGRRYAAVAVSSFIAKLIPGVATEGLRHSTQEGDATRFRPWETAMMIQGLCVMSIGILASCAFAYLWYFERSDAVTNSWRRDDGEAMPPPVEIASVQMSALGTMASTPPATPPRKKPLHRRTPSPAAPMRTPISAGSDSML